MANYGFKTGNESPLQHEMRKENAVQQKPFPGGQRAEGGRGLRKGLAAKLHIHTPRSGSRLMEVIDKVSGDLEEWAGPQPEEGIHFTLGQNQQRWGGGMQCPVARSQVQTVTDFLYLLRGGRLAGRGCRYVYVHMCAASCRSQRSRLTILLHPLQLFVCF